MPPNVPEIEVLPTPTPVTSPLVGIASLTCAMPPFPDVQLSSLVQSSVVPSLKLQNPVSCTLVPFAIAGSGVIVIAVKVAAVTVTVVEPWMPLNVATIGVLPTLTPVASPTVGEVLLTCAIEVSAELQLTCVVRFCTLPSLKLPSAPI